MFEEEEEYTQNIMSCVAYLKFIAGIVQEQQQEQQLVGWPVYWIFKRGAIERDAAAFSKRVPFKTFVVLK